MARKIEDTINDSILPVNAIAIMNRGIEILEENDCNAPKFLKDEARKKYRAILWLLNNQVYDAGVDLMIEWGKLKK